MNKNYIATVQIAIPNCSDGEDACDAVSAMLTDTLCGNGALLDWGYLKIGGQRLLPAVAHITPKDIEDRTIFE